MDCDHRKVCKEDSDRLIYEMSSMMIEDKYKRNVLTKKLYLPPLKRAIEMKKIEKRKRDTPIEVKSSRTRLEISQKSKPCSYCTDNLASFRCNYILCKTCCELVWKTDKQGFNCPFHMHRFKVVSSKI